MEELIADVKPFIIVFLILVGLFWALAVAEKILTLIELNSERRAYDLIAEEEELEIKNKKEQEKQNAELHKAKMALAKKQMEQADAEIRKANRVERPVVTQPTNSTISRFSRQNKDSF